MKLLLSKEGDFMPDDFTKRCINLMFRVLAKDLGIDNKKETVEIKFINAPDYAQDVQGFVQTETRHPIKMSLVTGDMLRIALSLSHEMVHVRDMVNGDLTVSENDAAIYYKTQRLEKPQYGREEALANMLPPHEVEPHAIMFDLAEHAVRVLAANIGELNECSR